MTTPFPITQVAFGLSTPEGSKWNLYFLPSTTIVCPALDPPATRAHTSYDWDRISTSFPFPSSPHCPPSTTSIPDRVVVGEGVDLVESGLMYVSCLATEDLDSCPDPSVFSMADTLAAMTWICSRIVVGLLSGSWWHLVLLLSLLLLEPMELDCFVLLFMEQCKC